MTEEEKWLTPKEALEIAKAAHGDAALKIIIERMRGGILPAVASRIADGPDGEEPEITDEPTGIAANWWSVLEDDTTFWARGDAKFVFYDAVWGTRTARGFDIRFSAKTIKKMFPAPSAPLSAATPLKHAGGAPPKAIWEQVWIEIAARLYSGDLQPIKQKDIEVAILDIVMNLGDEVGETTARRKAKLLWDKINSGP